ncbi:MAG: tetratricopeptide repeat protein [Lachnospiraceae bacterium]
MKKVRIIIGIILCGLLVGCSHPTKDGVSLLQEKKYKEAIEVFQKAVDHKKDTGEAYRGMGIAYWELKDYEHAREAFIKAIDHDVKKTGTLYNFIGICDMKEKNPKSALNYFRLALAMKGNSKSLIQEVEYNEIIAYEQIEDWESAKVKLEQYIEKYPEDSSATKEAEFLKTR